MTTPRNQAFPWSADVTGVVSIYVTHPNADAALALGRELVECGLAACANVLPGMTTVYRCRVASIQGPKR